MPLRTRKAAVATLVPAVAALVAGAASGKPAVAGPIVTAGPAVIGIAAAGKRLTGLTGTWAGSGQITYHFQWYRCNAAGAQCLSVHGATSPSYALVARDVGKAIGLTVSATDSAGTTSAYTSLIGPIAPPRPLLESTGQPAVAGPPVEGKTVQVTTGTWSPTPTKVTYTWERCNANGRVCAVIANATGNSYTVTTADVGHALLVLVQATFGPTSQNAFSTATPAAVDASVAGPVPVTQPAVDGTPVERHQLNAGVGIWESVGPISFTYQWYRCDTTGGHCASIHGATRSTYTLVAKDAGETAGLTVRATDATGTSVAYASLYGPIASTSSSLGATGRPTITGTTKAGQALTASNGSWTTPPTGYGYTWLRCNQYGRLCLAVPAARSPTYPLTTADTGHTLIVAVQASAGHSTQAAFSAATAPVT